MAMKRREARMDAALENLGMCSLEAVASAVVGNVVGGLMSDGGGGGGGGGGGPAYDPALSAAQTAATNQQTQIAGDLWNYYKANYQPVETGVINAGADINSPEAVARLQGQVNADQTAQFDAARKAAQEQRRGLGINPASPAASADDNTMALAEASSKAGAINAVKPAADAAARQYNFDVANLGKNLPASSMSGFGAAASGYGNQNMQNLNAQNSAFNRGVTSSYMRGQAAAPFVKAANDWFKTNWNPAAGGVGGAGYGANDGGKGGYTGGGAWSEGPEGLGGVMPGDAWFRNGGPVRKGCGIRMAAGGEVEPDGDGLAMRPDGRVDGRPGGEVEGPGGPTDDQVPAMLSDGEFVMSAAAVRAKGEDFFQRINDKYSGKTAGKGFGVGRA